MRKEKEQKGAAVEERWEVEGKEQRKSLNTIKYIVFHLHALVSLPVFKYVHSSSDASATAYCTCS